MNSIEGKCLIASPHLEDPNFFRSVVFIVRHDESEAFGVLINRPTDQKLNPILEELCHIDCTQELLIYQGGPVEGPILALHDNEPLGDIPCIHGVYLSSSESHLVQLAKEPNVRVRVFAGYSGWGPGQLDDELAAGGWLVAEITADELFGPCNEIWQVLMNKVGRDIISQGVPRHSIPNNPNCN